MIFGLLLSNCRALSKGHESPPHCLSRGSSTDILSDQDLTNMRIFDRCHRLTFIHASQPSFLFKHHCIKVRFKRLDLRFLEIGVLYLKVLLRNDELIRGGERKQTERVRERGRERDRNREREREREREKYRELEERERGRGTLEIRFAYSGVFDTGFLIFSLGCTNEPDDDNCHSNHQVTIYIVLVIKYKSHTSININSISTLITKLN
eukprot:sb/3470338/